MEKETFSFGKWYDAIMFILIMYVLIELALEVVVPFPSKTLRILSWIDFGICILFLTDWFYFLFKSPKKGRYIRVRIIDLVSSIPFTQILRPLRLLRLIRLTRTLRMIRGLKGVSPFFRIIFKNAIRSALVLYLLLTLIIFAYCSLGLYNFEMGLNDSITGLGDVIWMSFTTLTTVGYGDLYPVTTGGRVMAGILVVTGMGLFGLLTAEIATTLLEYIRRQRQEEE